jgi:hypothetical protein
MLWFVVTYVKDYIPKVLLVRAIMEIVENIAEVITDYQAIIRQSF